MADGGVDIDLYADDIESDFNRQEEFGGDNVDLYDDVISAPSTKPDDGDGPPNSVVPQHSHPPEETNGNVPFHGGSHGHHGRRFQLYVGNLTWWATDQDIANAIADVGVADFQDVKFFENRANGQSKGFCVISLGSDQSIRMIMDRLPKKEIHGQHPVVTLPTKQALNQFESQSKTRSTPPGPNNPGMRGPHPGGPPGPHPGEFFGGGPNGPGPNGPRMMMTGPGPHQLRGPPPHHPQHHLPQHQPPPHHMAHQPPPHQGPPPHRPPMQFQGPPTMQRAGVPGGPGGPGPRPVADWGVRPPHTLPPQPAPQYGLPHHQMQHQMPPPHAASGQGMPPHHQMPPHQQGPIRGPAPMPQHPGVGGAPAPHVNPAFFSQQPPGPQAPTLQPPPQQGPPGPGGPYGHPGHGAPPPSQGPLPGSRPPYGRQPQNYPPGVEAGRASHHAPPLGPTHGPHPTHPAHAALAPHPVISEVEFEEVMSRNRTVSSSAIARAVSDAAAGEYASAIETLVTAISLIKQSKVAHDDRCKILISSLQDTLHGVETKSYSSGERSRRSRSRDRDARAHHRTPRRRERSASRYRERSRDREERDRYRERSRERDRERDRDAYYRDYRERERDRSRSRERERADHYNRGHSREERPRKSPVEAVPESGAGDAAGTKSRTAAAPYYDERYRDRRERDPPPSDRDRERDHRRDARH